MKTMQSNRLDSARYRAAREAGISFNAVAQSAGVSAQRLYTNARFSAEELAKIEIVIDGMLVAVAA